MSFGMMHCLMVLLQTQEICPAMQHRHTTQNNWDTPFDFTSENYEQVCLAAHGV